MRPDAAWSDQFVLKTSGAIAHKDGGAPAVIFFALHNKDIF